MKFRHTMSILDFRMGGLLALATFKTFKILPDSNRVLRGVPVGIAAPTFGILLCLVVFISALGSYLVFFAFNKIKRLNLTFLPHFKAKVYDTFTYLCILYIIYYMLFISTYMKK